MNIDLNNPYIQWLLARSKERTTWVGAIAILSSFGITIAPEMIEHFITAGLAVSGLIAIFVKDVKPQA